MSGIPKETDIIVVGSGVSGLAAALTAAEGGARVVVFEKQRSLGGTSNFFNGMFAVESELQRMRYITYSRDEAFKRLMEYSHWRANPRLVRAFVNESGPTISWLIGKGVEFVDATINMPDAPRTYHVVRGTGEAVIKVLVTAAREKGVDIRPGVAVKKVLKQEDRVAGAIVEEGGEEVRVAAKAVVIASGGYVNNREWVKKYTGFDVGVNLAILGNTDKMGEGIRMAWEAGAAEEGMGLLEVFRVGPLGPDHPRKSQIEFAAAQPDLWVNPGGERFCDEGICFYDSAMGNANVRYKEGYTWSIFDDGVIERVMTYGVDKGIAWINPPGTKATHVYEEMEAAFARGSTDVFRGDSVEALAARIGIDPATLRATVEEYNRFCDKGRDEVFAKNPKYLRRLKGPRFYAVKAKTVSLGTMGGIKINHKTEVIDKKGKVIPGLYAVGFDAAGMWGDSYSIKDSSGAAAGFAVNSGRIAGKNALRFVG